MSECSAEGCTRHQIIFHVDNVTCDEATELFHAANTTIHDAIPVGAEVVPQLVSFEDD